MPPIAIIVILVALVLFLVAFLLVRTAFYGRPVDVVQPVAPIEVDHNVVAEHLAAAIRCQTISNLDRNAIDTRPFDELLALLERFYPRLHATLHRERFSRYTQLFTWVGENPELEPVLFAAHIDVVPADPATEKSWTHPPFSGDIADHLVWGRGALDTKCSAIAVMEAVEALLKTDYKPQRTIYLAFGHDEEIGGAQGAALVAQDLKDRGITLSAVIDEGGAITQGLIPGLDLPVALIGLAEKGHVTVELSAQGQPGHSSTPPPHTAIGVLARAIARLEANPMPSHPQMLRMMIDAIGLYLPFRLRLIFANFWAFGGLANGQLSRDPRMNAMIRTSTAVTIISGGIKDNVLPAQAKAAVNFRLFPGDTIASVVNHVRKAVADPAVQIRVPEDGRWEASPVSSVNGAPYRELTRTIRECFPDALVAPYLMLGASDSRYYTIVSNQVFRFSPYLLSKDLMDTIHGIDERIPTQTLGNMVIFYARLMQVWTGSL